MGRLTNFLGGGFVVASMFAALPAQAVVITYGGQTATDGSGLTSSLINASNQLAFGGQFYIETFDRGTAMTGAPSGLTVTDATKNIFINSGTGAVNSFNTISVTADIGGLGVRQGGVVGVAANPLNDVTNFAYGPGKTGATSATVTINYSNVLAATGKAINYFGFYYGSIDNYNDMYFYNSSGTEIAKVLGSTILNALGGVPGSWTDPKSNQYVNLSFAPEEAFTSMKFVSTGVAVEMDNIVAGINVPEPASIALLGLGLLGLGAVRRRKS